MIVTSGLTMLFELFQPFSHRESSRLHTKLCTLHQPVSFPVFSKTWILTSQWIYSSVLWCGCIWLSMKTIDTHNLSFSKVTNRTNGFESRWTPSLMRTNQRPSACRTPFYENSSKLNENIHKSSRGKVAK